eukprot:1479818-Pleurochrysis_carterae.AAC.2
MSALLKYSSAASPKSGFTTQLIACRPQSAGRVRLSSAAADAKPLIEDLYLSAANDADIKTLREGIKLGRKMINARAFDEYRGEEVYPGSAVRTDEQIDEYIRGSVHSANALTSSCRMGASSDPMAVLDSQLRVRGVGGLRVADSSAMPHIIGGQTCAPTLMLAEKAAHMMLQQRLGVPTSQYKAAGAAKFAAAAV